MIKIISEFPDYGVDKTGNVWSFKKWNKRVSPYKLKLFPDKDGYLQVILSMHGRCYTKKVHRLVLITFIGPCPKGMVCCHNNGIRSDNRLSNLRWDTTTNNHLDKNKHGTMPHPDFRGENHLGAKLTENDIITIREERGNKSAKKLSTEYSVSLYHIYNVWNRHVWKHI